MEGTAPNLQIDAIDRHHLAVSLGDLPELDIGNGRVATRRQFVDLFCPA